MVPYKDGGANEGHSCVKGRFAFGYATHPDRVLEADDARADHRRRGARSSGTRRSASSRAGSARSRPSTASGSIGGITSSRRTNEEVYVVQKMVRAAFGNNNVDTCARVCHSPTGYGLKQTFGTSAGTQDFKSVDEADVIVVIGANPTDGHPVFASRMKQRLRAGRQADRHRPAPDRPGAHAAHRGAAPPAAGARHQRRRRSTRWRTSSSPRVWSTEDVRRRALRGLRRVGRVHRPPGEQPGGARGDHRRPGRRPARRRAAVRRRRRTPRSTTASASPSTARARRWSWAWPTSRWPPATSAATASASTRCAARTTCRARATWARSRTSCPATGTSPTTTVREIYETLWGRRSSTEPGLRIPNMFDAALDGSFRGAVRAGRGHRPVRPQHPARARRRSTALELLVVQDLFLNETAKFAHVLLPGTSFLEKDGTFTNAERRINRVRPVMAPRTGKHEWEIVCEIAQAMGYPMPYDNVAARSWTRSPRPRRRSPECRSTCSTRSAACSGRATTTHPLGTAIMHEHEFVRGKGTSSRRRTCRPTSAAPGKFPLILTTGRILSQYNVGAQTRRTANVAWHPEDILEIHPHDAEDRGIRDGDEVDAGQPGRRDHAARASSPTGCRSASSTRRSTTRSPAPTS